MLDLQELSFQVGTAPQEQTLLNEVSVQFPKKHFVAILGPSGCGKSTLLKVIAGVNETSSGLITWNGRDLADDGDFEPNEIGYVPQFSIAYELLTVFENVHSAVSLRVRDLEEEEAETLITQILKEVGLEEAADRQVRLLSGGQKRRLALAMEMVSSPQILLCDEVTSGLDPKAEDEIVRLMHRLSRVEDRIVLSVTHSLRHLALYDSVLVLFQGHVAYYGAPATLLHYFNVEHGDELFPRLATRKPEEWHGSWIKHREAYAHVDVAPTPVPEMEPISPTSPIGPISLIEEEPAESAKSVEAAEPEEKSAPRGSRTPNAFTQFRVLFARRWLLLFRDRGQLILQLALLLGFPCLVVIFALEGLPQLKSLTDVGGNVLQQIQSEIQHRAEFLQAGSLVSGLIMFQVVLLALTGSNNAAREIASERLIFEKEKFAGLRPGAYVASKAAFLGVLVMAQSVWMCVFVNLIVRFPGSLVAQITLLVLVNAALTAICLGISSFFKTGEQASLVSVYLVGFQLPLSGAVLALPSALSWITRPVIASYWAWSGFIQTLRDTRLYGAVQSVTQTQLASFQVAVWVLLCHVVLGVFLAYTGCKNSRWE